MRRLCVLATAGALACAAACSSNDSATQIATDDAGSGTPASDAGTSPQGDGAASGGDASPAAYAGGDVTVSIGAADGGTADGGAVSGPVVIHMVPTTPAAIAKIEALVDGTVVGAATQAPFDVAWDSSSVGNGAHTVSARPYDLAGLTGTANALSITTSNFLLAGKWNWSSITDSEPGFGADPCNDTTFTVTFDPSTSTVTLPSFYLKCTAQNNAPYSSKIDGFSKVVAPADYGGPIVNTTGTVTTTLSTTMLRQTNSFNNNTQSGTLTRVP